MNYEELKALTDQIDACNSALKEKPKFCAGKVHNCLHALVDDGILKIIKAKRDSLVTELKELLGTDVAL